MIGGDDLTRRGIGDWNDWHRAYEDPESELVGRKLAVQHHVAAVVDEAPPGAVTVVSICGGQGHELIGALGNHPRRDEVRGRLVELDPENAAYARQWARDARLTGLEVVTGDASVSDAYAGLGPVDLVVISGVFGHLDEADRQRLVSFLHQILRDGGSVVWTSHRRGRGPAEQVRSIFTAQSFEEVAFDDLPGDEFGFTVARHRASGEPDPFVERAQLFTFGSSRQRREPTGLAVGSDP